MRVDRFGAILTCHKNSNVVGVWIPMTWLRTIHQHEFTIELLTMAQHVAMRFERWVCADRDSDWCRMRDSIVFIQLSHVYWGSTCIATRSLHEHQTKVIAVDVLLGWKIHHAVWSFLLDPPIVYFGGKNHDHPFELQILRGHSSRQSHTGWNCFVAFTIPMIIMI